MINNVYRITIHLKNSLFSRTGWLVWQRFATEFNITKAQQIMKKVYVIIILYQRVKDRASRMQSESLLSGFAEAQPIFEATPQ